MRSGAAQHQSRKQITLLLDLEAMSVSEILRGISSLSPEQRWQIIQRTREMLGAEIPDSFKQGMQEIANGEVIELDEALF